PAPPPAPTAPPSVPAPTDTTSPPPTPSPFILQPVPGLTDIDTAVAIAAGAAPRFRRSPPFACTSSTLTPRRSPPPSRSTGPILVCSPSIATGHVTPRRHRTILRIPTSGRSRRSDGTRRTARPPSAASRRLLFST